MMIPTTMRALQLQAINQPVEVTSLVPQPKPDEVLVRTISTTICTSDLNDIAHNPFGITLPRVIGHEAAGIIAAVGNNIHGLQPGDRVAAHPVIPCKQCDNCRRGLEHLCAHMGHLGLDRDGTFAEYFAIRADRVRRVPGSVAWKAASLLEPVAVSLEAVERGRIQTADSVLVVGDGPFGIIIARLAAGCEPRKLIMVGRHDFRLGSLPEAVRINESRVADARQAVFEANNGTGVDVAIMAVGTQPALDLCLASLRARGRLVVFSAVRERPAIDLFRVHTHELEVLGACNDRDLVDAALEKLSDPQLRLESLVTHELPFAKWPRAFDLARHGKDEVLKVALTFGEDR
jgi:threonine dehydrogenase-like Zn-dependent dehydrogenase